MEGHPLPLSPRQGVIRPVRPVRDWFALTHQHGMAPSPSQATDLILTALRAIRQHGAPVRSDAIWMDQDGRVELVLPSRGGCSESICLASLGVLACEVVSGEPADNVPPSLALSRARFRVLATHPYDWTIPFEFALGRLLGLSTPFQGVEDALAEFELLAARKEQESLMAYELMAVRAEPSIPEMPTWVRPITGTGRAPGWLIHGGVGFLVASLLAVGGSAAYRAGMHRAEALAPRSTTPAQPEAPRPILIDAAGLAAIAQALRPPAQEVAPVQPKKAKAVPAKTVSKPTKAPAGPDDGPIYVGQKDAGQDQPLGGRKDPNRVVVSDFVVKR